MKKLFIVVLLFSTLLFFGCTTPQRNTFTDSGNTDVCVIEGKPIIRMYSATYCPHCEWVAPAFDEVVQEYVAQEKIVAMHWELDVKDDILTPLDENAVPELEYTVFKSFNSKGSIPTFVFGCKYYRIGTAFEQEDNLEGEKQQFREFIEKTISASNTN